MKLLLLLVVRLYWQLVPPERRRRCIFRQSCSRFVYDATVQGGALAGLRSLRKRIRTCRPGYTLLSAPDIDGGKLAVLANGEIVRLDMMSPLILQQFRSASTPAVDTGSNGQLN